MVANKKNAAYSCTSACFLAAGIEEVWLPGKGLKKLNKIAAVLKKERKSYYTFMR